MNNEGLIDSFWKLNGNIKIRESCQPKPASITHESDLQFRGVHLPDIIILLPGFAEVRRGILDARVNEICRLLFFYF